MPQGDRTGPRGQGPMTGRGLGYCASSNVSGFMNSGFGRGFGIRRGFRAGFIPMNQFQPTVITEKEEKEYLEKELEVLKEEITSIQKRLNEFK
jgi:hypothetical protein